MSKKVGEISFPPLVTRLFILAICIYLPKFWHGRILWCRNCWTLNINRETFSSITFAREQYMQNLLFLFYNTLFTIVSVLKKSHFSNTFSNILRPQVMRKSKDKTKNNLWAPNSAHVKGTLMQNWKSTHIFVFIWNNMLKVSHQNIIYSLKHLTMRTWDMWKVCRQTFRNSVVKN